MWLQLNGPRGSIELKFSKRPSRAYGEAMKVFQELTVRGNSASIQQWLAHVSRIAAEPWQRDTVREKQLAGYYCFTRKSTGDVPKATLYLIERTDGLDLANIVPFEASLNVDQYNAILREFHDHYLAPLREPFGLRISLGPDTRSLDDVLPRTVQEKLHRFSAVANKTTGAGHSLDHKRWMDFLVSAHEARVDLDAGILRRLLEDELGWPEDGAAELARDYDSARELLSYYSERGSIALSTP